VRHAGAAAGAIEDFIDAVSGKRLPTARTLQRQNTRSAATPAGLSTSRKAATAAKNRAETGTIR